MKAPNPAGKQVRHKLQIHFDAHEYELSPDEIAEMSDDFDSLAVHAGNFPQADVRVVVEKNGRNGNFVVKLTLILPNQVLVTSDHERTLHPAFRRALDSLEIAFTEYLERLDGVHDRQQRHEAAKQQPTIEAGPVDETALESAAANSDYPAFRAAITPYEEWLRLRVGRWVERYPDVQARMNRDFDVLDLTEGVFLMAFEQYAHRRAEVRFRDWLEGLIDPTVKDFAHDPVRERENVNMARSACAVDSK
jgi:ribosome-associated translation inhibitor RaiA